MKNMKRILAVVLALAFVFCFAACAKTAEGAETTTAAPAGDLSFKFTAVDLDGNKTDFDVPFTDGQTVGEALLAEELIAGEDGDYGLYVKTVNGITLDYEADGAYWSFYIGEEPASTGVDGEKAVADGVYQFVATKG